LYQHYPGFEEDMRQALRGLLGKEVKKQVVMGLAKDGSGVSGASRLYFCHSTNLARLTFFPFAFLTCVLSAALGALQATKHNRI
jgi:hypothetical protein